jgi:hypothetical protein
LGCRVAAWSYQFVFTCLQMMVFNVYACVDILRWDVTHHSGETISFAHERCNSKKEAEEAGRRLLVEYAKHFSAENTVEARVICDLEWDDSED